VTSWFGVGAALAIFIFLVGKHFLDRKNQKLKLTSSDSLVRWEAVCRLAPAEIPDKMMKDHFWVVRLEVAEKTDPSRLPEMMGDEHWIVRRMVAQRISVDLLPKMMRDPEWDVRLEVAKRIPPRFLTSMLLENSQLNLVGRDHVIKVLRDRLTSSSTTTYTS